MTLRIRPWLAAALAALATPAAALDLALVIDAGAPAEGRPSLDFAVEALNARGYEVHLPASAEPAALRDAVTGFAERLPGADRAILFVAGRSLTRDGRIWLLPPGFEGEGWLDASFEGLPIDTLLALARRLPGRAAVVLGRDTVEGDRSLPRNADVPQGVLLLVGGREPAIAAVTDRLLGGPPAAAALRGLADMAAIGFVGPDTRFAPPPAPEPDEEAAAPADAPSPAERARAGEAALGLDQAARRRVQEDLTVLGFGTRGIDGIFGPGTRIAIEEWQRRAGFEPTGYLAPDQIARLRAEAERQTAELAAEAERVRAAEEAADAEFWRRTGAGGAAPDLRAYLARYPDGLHAAEARAELDRLEAAARSAAAAEDRAAWDAAAAEATVEGYRRYLEARPEGAFAGEAEARIAELEAAPREAALREEARAREDGLGLNQASRALIESQLAAVGYDVGARDGTFDDDTRRALREFQTRQGLPVTGYVDQGTIQALIVASLGMR